MDNNQPANQETNKSEIGKSDIKIEKKWTNDWNVSANYDSDNVTYKQFDSTQRNIQKNLLENTKNERYLILEEKNQKDYDQKEQENQKEEKKGWKPKLIDTNTKEGQMESDIKTAKGYLNKMTGATFEKLSEQYMQIALKDPTNLLKKLIDQIFEQALTQPSFCSLYSNLCSKMFNHPHIKSSFTKELLGKCQEEFQRDDSVPTGLTGDDLLEYQFKAKRRMLGNIKFIGELYKNKILVAAIIHACIRRLLKTEGQQPDEEQMEALCKLLTNVGIEIDTEKSKQIVDNYFMQIREIKKKVPPRIRFLLEDLETLRTKKWLSTR